MEEHQHVVLPIRHKDNTLGVVTLYLNPEDKLDSFRLRFLEAAASAAGAALEAQMAREEVLRTQEKYIAQAISSQEEERKRVAYDLHDQICQSLSAILLEIQSKRSRSVNTHNAQTGLEERIRELIDQVRQMAGQLRPAILDDYGLESALSHKIKDISGLKGIKIDYQSVRSIENKKRLPANVETGLYRTAMEALNNAISHASPYLISVITLWQEGKVTLLVEDDGCGFDYASIRKNLDRCRGLIDMEERIAVLGGTLRIESAPNHGTTVRAEVPTGAIQ
jgi:signal transduction histidine kinase